MIGLAYLHGFSSSSRARKGLALGAELARAGVELERPELHHPSFAATTVTGALGAIDRMAAARSEVERWRFVGSSFGGYLAARWAQLHPGRVDRLLLLAPAFDLAARWRALLGEEAMTRWERTGALPFEDPQGGRTSVHWELFRDFLTHPAFPAVEVPTLVLHGRSDLVVPIEGSRRWVAENPGCRLVEVDDDHGLLASLPEIVASTWSFLLQREPPEAGSG